MTYRSRTGEGATVGSRTAEMEACLAAACGEEKNEDTVGGGPAGSVED